jgi:phosphate:Na+ symporter
MWQNGAAFILSVVAFLGGLTLMRHGMSGMSRGRLTVLLKEIAKSPTRGILTGTIATAAVQSSAAITAITVGLVAGGSLSFRNGLGIILGSNVGSTITPQILTLNLWGVVIPSLIAGILGFFSRRKRFYYPSMALTGFASIFIALESLETSLKPLTSHPVFMHILSVAGKNVLIGMLAGCLVSALIQSSTATTVVTMALAADGAIHIEGAIAIILGANIGTCITSVIAAIGQSIAAKQVALAHVMLNLVGAFAFMPFLHPFAILIAWMSPNASQQIANAHTIFNLACTVFVWPITTKFASFIEQLLPDKIHA